MTQPSPESAAQITDKKTGQESPAFDAAFQRQLDQLIQWRRDVRRFRSDPITASRIDALIALSTLAPSVGFSQPWRFVKVDAPARRQAIREDFLACNREALADYQGERANRYAKLKLSGLDDAPVQLAVFCDNAGETGHGLGQKTMPETRRYSVVMAVHTLWLAARAQGIGVGWVSILNPAQIATIVEVPDDWSLIAYLCVGYPQEEHQEPELERYKWEKRQPPSGCLLQR